MAWPSSAASAGGITTLALLPSPPVPGRSPKVTSGAAAEAGEEPTVTRPPSVSTARAALRNAPIVGPALTRAGGATRHTNGRRSSARSSSGASSASPTHQPGGDGGRRSVTVVCGAARARPTSGVPPMVIATARSVARTAAMPRLGGTAPAAARAMMRTPGVGRTVPVSAVRCRSLTTCTSLALSGSASTSVTARATAATRSSRRGSMPALSTAERSASGVPARATPSASTSQQRSAGARRPSTARAATLSRSSTGRPSTTAPADSELSSTTTSAVGAWTRPPPPACPPPAPRVDTRGRAAASTTATINAVRSSRRSRCRSRRRRALRRSASLR